MAAEREQIIRADFHLACICVHVHVRVRGFMRNLCLCSFLCVFTCTQVCLLGCFNSLNKVCNPIQQLAVDMLSTCPLCSVLRACISRSARLPGSIRSSRTCRKAHQQTTQEFEMCFYSGGKRGCRYICCAAGEKSFWMLCGCELQLKECDAAEISGCGPSH